MMRTIPLKKQCHAMPIQIVANGPYNVAKAPDNRILCGLTLFNTKKNVLCRTTLFRYTEF